MSLLLALQTPLDITGSGASSFGFSVVSNALETFEGSGAASFGFTDGGVALETFLGNGTAAIILADAGAGSVEEGQQPDAPPNGGGWVYRDRDRGKTVRAFQRLLYPKPPARRPQPEPKRLEEIFAYVSDSAFAVSGQGQGKIHGLLRGAGASVARLECRGQGRIEESAADIIRLLLSLDEI